MKIGLFRPVLPKERVLAHRWNIPMLDKGNNTKPKTSGTCNNLLSSVWVSLVRLEPGVAARLL
jgi:hypothetical protein